MKKIVVFDFDDVLFETAKFKCDLRKIFAKYGVGPALFEKSYKLSYGSKGYWRPKKQISILSQARPLIKKDLIFQAVISLFKQCRRYLFKDVEGFFKKISGGGNWKLILATFGEGPAQAAKIRHCGIEQYFDTIKVVKTREKDSVLETLVKTKKAIILIEDRGRIVDRIKKNHPQIKTIHLKRPSGRYLAEKSRLADFTVLNLKQVKEILENIV